MATEAQYQALLDRFAQLRQEAIDQLGVDLLETPRLADALVGQIDDYMRQAADADSAAPAPPDSGLAQLVGIGPEAARQFGQTRIPQGVEGYDETVTSERIIAIGDLYYIYQHERVGVFRVVRKLRELFRNGAVRLSSGPGAYGLYQFDRREVLRGTRHERAAAYRRAFGYGAKAPLGDARPNREFHPLFTLFNRHVAQYWRDKRISDVIRDRANDPTFGSIAVVRRAGLDLRNNLKFVSYGNINVLRVEVMQLLEEAFRILDSDDVKRVFGADNAWDVIEEVLTRYFHEPLMTSPRQRMAVTGREILRWLAQAHVLQTGRTEFEALLLQVAEHSEEWLTSAQAIGVVADRRAPQVAALPAHDRRPRPVAAVRSDRRRDLALG
ncbi:hypothetical protein [Geodermatophilus sp. DSM 45219]|uniref:hypothetical protein n=1 Tax=Geodermatophilus sp. DSM 45219 TaxID=1881103 RepID=UPI000889410E|nr:hypothetical protein [Geodermatophilus sp. DSM 45219]SDN41297.1 hypothetical protein SAMN05428965_0288 [Geodermatophilus sp. DSM 45219]